MTRSVLLVRHTEVALAWKQRCYGCHDVGLSRAGLQCARTLAVELAREPVTTLIHSGLKRAALLAHHLAKLKGLRPKVDARWRERDFGSWETRSWNAIWREAGNAMDRMLTDPHEFRPGGGETTAELVERSVAAWRDLPRGGLTIVITHGGSIAAIRATQAGASLGDIARYLVAEGSVTRLDE